MASPAPTAAAASSFVFPGSATRNNRDRNVSFDLSGTGSGSGSGTPGSATGKRGMDDGDDNGVMENPLLRNHHIPLANVQQNGQQQYQPQQSLFSPTADYGSSNSSTINSSPAARPILRNRKPNRSPFSNSGSSSISSGGSSSGSARASAFSENFGSTATTTTASSSSNRSSQFGLPPKQSFFSDGGVPMMLSSMATAATNATSNTASKDSNTSVTMAPYSYDNMPPKSATSAAGSTTSGTPSAAASTWILVYGFVTTEQLQEVVQRFTTYGEVVDHVLPTSGNSNSSIRATGSGNWIALQYATLLQSTKALCHANECLSDGVTYCGVKALDHNDAIVWNHRSNIDNSSHHAAAPLSRHISLGGDSSTGTATIGHGWNTAASANATTMDRGGGVVIYPNGGISGQSLLQPDDVYLNPVAAVGAGTMPNQQATTAQSPNTSQGQWPTLSDIGRSICYDILYYLLGIPSSERIE